MKDGSPDILGATFTGEGVNFAVRSRAATRVDVCLYDSTGARETARLTLPGRTGPVHHGFVEQELARVGTLYGIRVHGVYDPREGYRFNANKLLHRPVGARHRRRREVASRPSWVTTRRMPRAHARASSTARRPCRVAASSTARSTGKTTGSPRCPGATRLIYELHVKGFTQLHPDVPPEWRGKYLGAHRAGGARTSQVTGRDRGRAHAGARLHQRGLPARARPH